MIRNSGRWVKGGGAVMNLPIVNNFGFDGDGSQAAHQAKLNYILQVGTLSSALEHAVPEQMFVTAEHPGEAISAVKALSKASAAGQRIYHLTPANRASTLPAIHHNSLVMNEIKNALNSGKEVITHTDAVSVPGWSGAGYIIYDPVTGDGAYKIGGGENGGFILIFISAVVFMALAIALITGIFWWVGLLFAGALSLAIEVLIGAISAGLAFKTGYDIGSILRDCSGLGAVVGLLLLGVMEVILAILSLTVWGGLFTSILTDVLLPDFTDDKLCSA